MATEDNCEEKAKIIEEHIAEHLRELDQDYADLREYRRHIQDSIKTFSTDEITKHLDILKKVRSIFNQQLKFKDII